MKTRSFQRFSNFDKEKYFRMKYSPSQTLSRREGGSCQIFMNIMFKILKHNFHFIPRVPKANFHPFVKKKKWILNENLKKRKIRFFNFVYVNHSEEKKIKTKILNRKIIIKKPNLIFLSSFYSLLIFLFCKKLQFNLFIKSLTNKKLIILFISRLNLIFSLFKSPENDLFLSYLHLRSAHGILIYIQFFTIKNYVNFFFH